MEELTTEQLEVQEAQKIKESRKNKLKMGEAVNRLLKNPDFKDIIMIGYIEYGKDNYWKNIRNHIEGYFYQPTAENERALVQVEKFKRKVNSIIDFEKFIRMIQDDYDMAKLDEAELERIAKEQENKE